MATSKSYANSVSLFRLAIGGAGEHDKKLPEEAATAATELNELVTKLEALNVEQESTKKRLKTITLEINNLLKAGTATRSKIVKFAEGTFGARAAEMDQFRPRTEGKVRKPKKKTAA